MLHIDFHVHTAERSSCATATQTEQIQAAIKSGLQAIAITDHFKLVPDHELARLNRVYSPFLILNGIEISANGEDWLVLGLTDPALETELWSYPRLHQYVHTRGGLIILAHPFRYHATIDVDLITYPPDAVELRSNNIRFDLIPQIRHLADQLKIPTLCNSDAHSSAQIGRYFNIFDLPQVEPDQILKEVKTGSMSLSIV